MSIVENKLLDSKFIYEPPWFYSNKLSLRCELGIGNKSEYLSNAINRALEIFDILFKNTKPDCSFFNEYLYEDYSFDYSNLKKDITQSIEIDINNTDMEQEENLISIKRNIKYDVNPLDIELIIKNQVIDGGEPIIHFVSFKNEFIFSIYDDRGCDIVFFNDDKYKEFYIKLEKYLLDYDRKIMKDTFYSLNKN